MYLLKLHTLIRDSRQLICPPRVIINALGGSRTQSTLSTSDFRQLATEPTSKFQVYISRSRNPYINLSIEHFLLQNSPAESTVLFLYVNRACVVIGRNQNPWLEVDLRLLRDAPALKTQESLTQQENASEVLLVRRRSGGGTVFHDEGNVNYSVICPTPEFTRDKHVEMVVDAIRKANPRARVNERHDIVIDQGDMLPEGRWPSPSDMHRTAYASRGVPPKVSGSAYKLTRQRSLHHGTCLLASPNLGSIAQYLRSPAKPFMTARGVESVRSPVANIHMVSARAVENIVSEFQLQVVEAFSKMHSIGEEAMVAFSQPNRNSFKPLLDHQAVGYVNDELSKIPEIQAGIEELKSRDWIFGQTPQFILSSHTSDQDDRSYPTSPPAIPSSARVYIKARAGVITSSRISLSACQNEANNEAERFHDVLKDRKIQEVDQFSDILCAVGLPKSSRAVTEVAAWLNTMFGK